MAAGCCIVSSATPPVEELLQDGHSARLVDFFDCSAQAGAIEKLLNSPLTATACRRCRSEARDYSSVNGLKRWLELIEL